MKFPMFPRFHCILQLHSERQGWRPFFRCGEPWEWEPLKRMPSSGQDGSTEVRITAIQRGPMEIAGWLGQREKQLLGPYKSHLQIFPGSLTSILWHLSLSIILTSDFNCEVCRGLAGIERTNKITNPDLELTLLFLEVGSCISQTPWGFARSESRIQRQQSKMRTM